MEKWEKMENATTPVLQYSRIWAVLDNMNLKCQRFLLKTPYILDTNEGEWE
jgi:hypothetical protein